MTGGSEDYAFWTPTGVESDNSALLAPSTPIAVDPNDPFAPSWETPQSSVAAASSDIFRAENPRVNPLALKRDDESDSDDDIVNAFRWGWRLCACTGHSTTKPSKI